MAIEARHGGLIRPDPQAEAWVRRDHIVAPGAPDADLRDRAGEVATEIIRQNLGISGFDVQSREASVWHLQPFIHGVGGYRRRNWWRRIGGGEDLERQIEAISV